MREVGVRDGRRQQGARGALAMTSSMCFLCMTHGRTQFGVDTLGQQMAEGTTSCGVWGEDGRWECDGLEADATSCQPDLWGLQFPYL